MTTDRELSQRLTDWLEDQPSRAPDQLARSVFAGLEHMPQRAGWRSAARRVPMFSSRTSRLAVAAGALVIAVAGGAALLRGPAIGGPVSTPTPPLTASHDPSPDSTPSPSSTVARWLPSEGAVEPGRYVVRLPGSSVDLEFTVAESTGWPVYEARSYFDDVDFKTVPNGFYASYGSLSFWVVGNVFADACDGSSLPDPRVGATVEEVIAALDAQLGTDLQSSGTAVIGGQSASRVVIRPSEGVTCPDTGLRLWDGLFGEGPSVEGGPLGDVPELVLWILDVEDTLFAIVGDYDESDPPRVRSILAVLDSIEFSGR